MNYNTLIAEHNAIESAMAVLLSQSGSAAPRTEDVSASMRILSALLCEHTLGEGDLIEETVARSQAGRHAGAARWAHNELAELKDDWIDYLYRWDASAMAKNWPAFSQDTAQLMDRMQERLNYETMILYSLAHQHGLVSAD